MEKYCGFVMRPLTFMSAFLISLLDANCAHALNSSDVVRVHKEVEDFAARRGMSEAEFVTSIGTSADRAEARVYASEQGGASADATLQSLINFSEAMKNPDKRRYARCLGMDTGADDAPPSNEECLALAQRLGVPAPQQR